MNAPRRPRQRPAPTPHHGPGPGSNRFRIIAGQWRGRRLPFPPVPGVRPSPDRVRETLFNWLAPMVEGARCLDLFAGSGALGLEALSRGAASVIFVDQHREVVRSLRANLELLGCSDGEVVQDEATRFLRRTPQVMDILLLDPPYEAQLLAPITARVEAGGWIRDDGWVYLEQPAAAGEPPIPQNWDLVRRGRAGRVGYYLARRSRARDAAAGPRTESSE